MLPANNFVVQCCKHDDELSDSLKKGVKFLDSDRWNYLVNIILQMTCM